MTGNSAGSATVDAETAAEFLALADPGTAAAVAERIGTAAEADPDPDLDPDSGPAPGGTWRRVELRRPYLAIPGETPAATGPVAEAGRLDLTRSRMRTLLTLDDPHVDAVLFRHPRMTAAERRRLLAGVRRNGGAGAVGQPLVDLLWSADLARCRRWLADGGFTSGDLEVAAVVYGRLRLTTPAGWLRPLVAVWERHGAAEARALIGTVALPDGPAADVAFALAEPEPDRGLDRLRVALAQAEAPAALVKHLLDMGEGHETYLGQLVDEGGTVPWDALARAHARRPLLEDLHAALATRPDCPKELVLDLLRRGVDPPVYTVPVWLAGGLDSGRLTVRDVAAHAAPARSALSLLMRSGEHPYDPWSVGERLRERLGSDVDAWVVALYLVGDFAGTLDELADTAAAAVTAPAAGGAVTG